MSRPTDRKPLYRETALAAMLVLLITGCRFWIDTPNFQPVMAVALFAGMVFSRRWLGMVTVLSGMLMSDLLLGSYQWQVMLAVYLAVGSPLLLAWWIRRGNLGTGRRFLLLTGSSVGSAILFYIVTNLAVWGFSGWYPTTPGGLVSCLTMGLSFFKWTLASNLVFAGMLFGGQALPGLLSGWRLAARCPHPVPVTAGRRLR